MNPYQLTDIPTHDPTLVASAVQSLLPSLDTALIHHTAALFRGEIAPYQAIDTHYHDFEHTLQVTLCWARLVAAWLKAHAPTHLHDCHFQQGLAAALLHDSGYLKTVDDTEGTGAKYTLIHESRSCRVARTILSSMDWDADAILSVQRMIAATGPSSVIEAIPFQRPTEKFLAQALASADFLAQLADPRYMEKLPGLYAEFVEAAHYRKLPKQQWPYQSYESLVHQTPKFWNTVVFPKLHHELGALYLYLNAPYPDGPNPYLRQALQNIAALV